MKKIGIIGNPVPIRSFFKRYIENKRYDDLAECYTVRDIYDVLWRIAAAPSGVQYGDWRFTVRNYHCCLRIQYQHRDVATVCFYDQYNRYVYPDARLERPCNSVHDAKFGGTNSYMHLTAKDDATRYLMECGLDKVNWKGISEDGIEIRNAIIQMLGELSLKWNYSVRI